MPLLAVLEILSNQSPSPIHGEGRGEVMSFSQILKPLRDKFFISEEINFRALPAGREVSNPNILEDIRQKYQDAQIDETDGLSFSYPNWRFNVRKSNTENLLRLNLEANSEGLLEQKTREIVGLINRIK